MGASLSEAERQLLLWQLAKNPLPKNKTSSPTVDATPIEFGDLEHLQRGRLPGFEAIADRFSRLFRDALSRHLGHSCLLQLDIAESCKFLKVSKSLPMPSSLHLFRLSPLNGQGFLAFTPEFVSLVVEASFGGGGMGTAVRHGRDFSPIEHRLLGKVANLALEQLNEAWQPIYPLQHTYRQSEMNPLALNLAQGSEQVLIARYLVEMLGQKARMLFCIPMYTLEPVRSKLVAGFHAPREEKTDGFSKRVQDALSLTEVSISVELGQGRIKASELLSLQAGSILTLNTSFEAPAVILVEGVPKFLGKPGMTRGSKAVEVLSRIKGS